MTLGYDPGGRLYETVASGTTTRFLYDGDRLVAEYDVAGTLQRRYVHGPGVDEPLVQYQGAATTNRSFLHANRRGSVQAHSNTAGAVTKTYAYGPYGEPL